jgi:hypothetical protein
MQARTEGGFLRNVRIEIENSQSRIATVQFISLGYSRQSTNILPLSLPWCNVSQHSPFFGYAWRD